LIDLSVVTMFMLENFELVTISSNGTHFHARCPLCGDSKKNSRKKRFHLDWNNGNPGWKCFNCSRSGSFLKIYCLIKGCSVDEGKKVLYGFDPDRLKNSLSKDKPKEEPKIEISENFNYILDDCVGNDRHVDSLLLEDWLDVLNTFKSERQIPDSYKIYLAYKGRYQNRIIIPIFNNSGDIIYFQARAIPGIDQQPKYVNPPTKKSMIILNEDYFDREKFIVVTEGLIDAFMIGKQGTACLGKEITEEFVKILLEKTDKGVIIAFDNDKDGKKSLLKFIFGNKYGKKVKYFLMPDQYKICKDINNVCVKTKTGDVYDFVIQNSFNFTKTYAILKLLGDVEK